MNGIAVVPGKRWPPPTAEVGPNLYGYARVTVHAAAAESEQLPYDVDATVVPDGTGKLIVSTLTATQSADGPPIQRGELAQISIEPFVRFVANSTVVWQDGDKFGLPVPPDEFWERVAANGLTADDLADLARVYRWVRLQEGRPTTLIAQELGLAPATVRRWVAKAVEAGYLTQQERTK